MSDIKVNFDENIINEKINAVFGEKEVCAVLPLRGLTIMPCGISHFDIERDFSKNAINTAMNHGGKIFLTPQFIPEMPESTYDSVSNVGVIAVVKQVLKLPDKTMRVLIEGKKRAYLNSLEKNNDVYYGEIEEIIEEDIENTPEIEGALRLLRDTFTNYSKYLPNIPPDIYRKCVTTTDLGEACDFIAQNCPLYFIDKVALLKEIEVISRATKLCSILENEMIIYESQIEIDKKVKTRIQKGQKEMFLREQLQIIRAELGEGRDDDLYSYSKYEKQILSLKIDEKSKDMLLNELEKLKKVPEMSSESAVLRTYLDTCLAIPFNNETKDNYNIFKAEKILNRDHYGLEDVKDKILEYLAVKNFKSDLKGQILCLVGPPGIGKTSVAKSIASALNRKYARISLGGISDESEIRGHRKTYIGSMPGRIINALKESGSINPLILLDEIDKLGSSYKGDPTAALLEALDPMQNNTFVDHYIEIPVDLSKTFFITTANDESQIPKPLLDRMDIIRMTSYMPTEKFHIAKDYLIPQVLKESGLNKTKVKISDDALLCIIDNYTRESGVRNLRRAIEKITRKSAKIMITENKKSVKIDNSNIDKFLGPKVYDISSLPTDSRIGIVTGLAYTSVGGEILELEVSALKGTGKIMLTGNLGDMMKESANQAISFVRSRYKEYNIDANFYKNKDIHIHAPEGAVPKDGPSAGVTMATAIISELGQIPVRRDVAMTGEITIRGNVLKIGGLKEKTMAAFKMGIKKIIVPFDNLPDLEEIAKEVKENIEFFGAKTIDDVLEIALDKGEANGK